MRIKIFWVGKTKNGSIRSLATDYLSRTRHLVPCDVVEVRDPAKRRDLRGAQLLAAEEAGLSRALAECSRIVVLAQSGRQFTSAEFARWLEGEHNRGTREMAFVIGGPEGLSEAFSKRAFASLSLGKMTYTHEMCRVLLLEQVYRAFCILRNIPYHK